MKDKRFDDADKLYDEWRNANVITNKYPEYKYALQRIKTMRNQKEPDAMKELESLIGLKEVKTTIKDLLSRLKMNQELAKKGLDVQEFSMHMAFLGNPGTGKTIVANLYAQLLKEAGVLKEARCLSCNGTEHPNFKKVFKKGKGGVIFIDEAYSLYQYCDDNERGVASLIAEMENNRSDTVVILAGYKKSMDCLLDSNIGFRSRMGAVIEYISFT